MMLSKRRTRVIVGYETATGEPVFGPSSEQLWERFARIPRDSDAARSAETAGLGCLSTGKRGPKASPNPYSVKGTE